MSNKSVFLNLYRIHLLEQVRLFPDQYAWSTTELDRVSERMVESLATGHANKDSNAIRRTCKELGIPYRYKDIQNYLTH